MWISLVHKRINSNQLTPGQANAETGEKRKEKIMAVATTAEFTIERGGEYIAVIDDFNDENDMPLGEEFRKANRKRQLGSQSELDLSMLQNGDFLWIGMGKWLVYNNELHVPHLKTIFSKGEYIPNSFIESPSPKREKDSTSPVMKNALNQIRRKRYHTDGRGNLVAPRSNLIPELIKEDDDGVKYYRVTGDIKPHLVIINEETEANAIFSNNGFGSEFPEGNWIAYSRNAIALQIPMGEALSLLQK